MKKEKKECIFCLIIEGRSTSKPVVENDLVVAFYDVRPLSRGHVLIVTKKHYKNLLETGQEDWNAILPVLHEMTGKLLDEYSPRGFNFISNIGKEAFQSIEHFHIHLIPKYKKKEGFV